MFPQDCPPNVLATLHGGASRRHPVRYEALTVLFAAQIAVQPEPRIARGRYTAQQVATFFPTSGKSKPLLALTTVLEAPVISTWAWTSLVK